MNLEIFLILNFEFLICKFEFQKKGSQKDHISLKNLKFLC